jgi:Flp pilus assembly protein TadG
MKRRIGSHARRPLLRDQRGMSALEFALAALVLVPMIMAAADLGYMAEQQIQLQQALRAGGQYAMSFPTDITGIKNAVVNALPSNWTNITVGTPSDSCVCWTSGSTSTPSCDSSGSCTSGQVERFMTIPASSPYSSTFINTTISANYVARYK